MEFFTTYAYRPDPDFPEEFKTVLQGHKVVHLTDVPGPGPYGPIYARLAAAAGGFLNKNEVTETAEMVSDEWLDIRYDPEKVYSFRHSDTRQPLHTDGSYTPLDFDVIFFFCEQAAEYGGATTFIDGPEVLEYLQIREPALASSLQSTEVDFGKGNNLKTARIIDTRAGFPEFNWNHYRVADSNPEAVRQMAAQFHEFCETRLVEGGMLRPVTLKPGEAVFFHDRRVLHGRNAFHGARCLMKGAIKMQ